ncbi:MAG: hypothetical protein R3A79_19365 [Nannocystaceae bacterium]
MRSAASDDGLDAYGLDYDGGAGSDAAADLGIRESDRYVDAHDPLRASVAAGSKVAAVQLGVDPGTFFCGAQLAELLHLRGRPEFARLRVGFIHVPPDRSTGAQARSKHQLHGRAKNLEMIARVVAVALRGWTPATGGALVLTGFGAFRGVASNPTQAFIRSPKLLDRTLELAHPGARPTASRELARSAGLCVEARDYAVPQRNAKGSRRLKLLTGLLELAPSQGDALAGGYFSAELVAQHFAQLVERCVAANGGAAPAAILSLGVDSSQSTGARGPRFKIETQTRGWHRSSERRATATEHYQRDVDLARVFMAARAMAAAPLLYT